MTSKPTIFELLHDSKGISIDDVGCVYRHYNRYQTESALRTIEKSDCDYITYSAMNRESLFVQPYPLKISLTVGNLIDAERIDNSTSFMVPCTLENGLNKTVKLTIQTV